MKKSTNFDINRQTWWAKTGVLPVPMTNDYMFKAVCQKDQAALRSLISAVLHIDTEDIKSAHICNPIILGKAIDEKEYILDTKVELNNQIMLDLELQVINYKDWPERYSIFAGCLIHCIAVINICSNNVGGFKDAGRKR